MVCSHLINTFLKIAFHSSLLNTHSLHKDHTQQHCTQAIYCSVKNGSRVTHFNWVRSQILSRSYPSQLILCHVSTIQSVLSTVQTHSKSFLVHYYYYYYYYYYGVNKDVQWPYFRSPYYCSVLNGRRSRFMIREQFKNFNM